MGYLQIPAASLGNFTKGIISIWLRAPAATLSAVSALPLHPDGYFDGDDWCGIWFTPPMYKIIPLITFGSLETTTTGGHRLSPCFVGIDCSAGTGKTGPTLAVNLQTANLCSFNKPPMHPESEIRPEAYYMSGNGSRPDGSDTQTLYVTPDTWHHALISFDLSSSCSITRVNANSSPPNPPYALTGGPTFTWAFDDVDKTGPSMGHSGGALWSADGNAPNAMNTIGDNFIVPQGLFLYFSGDDISADPIEASTDLVISSSGGISQSGEPIGSPTSATFVDNIYNIELASLQFFTGISVDAGDVSIRRLFITSEGRPAAPTLAQSSLGQAPATRFDSSTDWITGRNRGSAGNFTPIGTINKFDTGAGL